MKRGKNMRGIKFLRGAIALATILALCQTLLIQQAEAQEVPEPRVSIPLTCEEPGTLTEVATGSITFDPDNGALKWAIDFNPPVPEQTVSVNAFLLCLGTVGADAQREGQIEGESQLVIEAALPQDCRFPTALLHTGPVRGNSGGFLYNGVSCISVFQLK
jgi:hypothetical protein